MKSHDNLRDLSTEELKSELDRLKQNLSDLEDMHSFTFLKTSAHIGSEKARNLQQEFEEDCKMYNRQIAEIEKELKGSGTI